MGNTPIAVRFVYILLRFKSRGESLKQNVSRSNSNETKFVHSTKIRVAAIIPQLLHKKYMQIFFLYLTDSPKKSPEITSNLYLDPNNTNAIIQLANIGEETSTLGMRLFRLLWQSPFNKKGSFPKE